LGLFMKTANTVYTKEYKLVADKPPYKKRKYNAGYISTEKMEKEVEVKAVDCIGSLVPSANVRLPWTFDQAARLTLVNGIFSGSTAWQRIGRRITLKRLRIKGYFIESEHEVDNLDRDPQYCRFFVVYDKKPTDTLPQIGTICNTYVAAAQGTDLGLAIPTSFKNLDNADRYDILLDKTIIMPSRHPQVNNANTLTATADKMHFDWVVNLGERDTVYAGVNGNLININTGALYFITWGDSIEATDSWNAQCNVRLEYLDA